MTYEEFVSRVRKLGDFEDEETAEMATEAVLETIGERLYKGAREDLMAQVVAPLKELLDRAPRTDRRDTDYFPLEEFYERVAARADTGVGEARTSSRAVISVLEEAVSRGEIEDVIEALGVDYRDLFEEARALRSES